MPKIIENLQDKLIEEAENQIKEFGYSAMTIRSVAKACGVGIGTVYNYFPSKDALVATYMLNDWKKCVSTINNVSQSQEAPKLVTYCIYEQIQKFAQKHNELFHDKAAITSFHSSFSQYHALLRSQLASPLEKFCDNSFTAEFIAESLLTWTIVGKSFDDIWNIIKNCF